MNMIQSAYVDLARSQLDDFENVASQAERSLRQALVKPDWEMGNGRIQFDTKLIVNGVEIPTKVTLAPSADPSDGPVITMTIPSGIVDVASNSPPSGLTNSDPEEAWEEFLDEYQNYDWLHVAEHLQDKLGSDIINSGSDILQDMLEPPDKFGYYDLEGRG